MPNKSCICEICQCGRHRCPVHPKANQLRLGDDGPCQITEYNNKYRAYEITGKPRAFKPEQQMVHEGGKLEDATTFKTDYIQHEMPPRFEAKQNVYQKQMGEMDMVTTYGKDYPKKHGDKAASLKPTYNYERDDVRFEGNPTYKDDFKHWKAERTQAIKKDRQYLPPTATMEDRTTMRTDFIPRDLPHTRNFKPDNMAMVNKEPFDDLTNHKINFIAHPMPEKFHRARDDYKPIREPLDSLTTAQRDFVGHLAAKQESCKPRASGVHSDARLDDATEFKDNFKNWELPTRDQKAKDVYMKPMGSMDTTTSHKKDFIAHELNPARSLKPANMASGDGAQFDDTTTFKTDFKAWQSHHEIRKDPSRKNYQLPSVPFEGTATYRAHYIEHGLNPVKSFKPDNFVEANRAPFQGDSSYKTEYTMKQIDPCPVTELPKHGYKFYETGPRGHQFYVK